MINKDNHHTAFFLSWQLEKHYNEHHTLRPGHEAGLHPPPPRSRRPCAPPRRVHRSRPPKTPAPRACPSARAAAAPPAASNRAPECPCPASASHRGRRRCAAGRGSRRRRPQRRTPRRARSCRTPARRRLAADPRIAGVRASPADPRQEHAGRGCNPWRPSYTPASATTTWTGGPQPRARRPWPSVARGTAAWGPARRQSSRPQRDGARAAGASGAERAERAVDVAVRRPCLLEPRHHSLTRPRERGEGGERPPGVPSENAGRPWASGSTPKRERPDPARATPDPARARPDPARASPEPAPAAGGERCQASQDLGVGEGSEGRRKRWSPATCIAPRRSAAASGRAGAGSPPRAEPGRAAASALLSRLRRAGLRRFPRLRRAGKRCPARRSGDPRRGRRVVRPASGAGRRERERERERERCGVAG